MPDPLRVARPLRAFALFALAVEGFSSGSEDERHGQIACVYCGESMCVGVAPGNRKAGAYSQPAGAAPARTEESQTMLDVFMLVSGIGFFALAVGYAVACERL
jgi:hypothetical protein